MPGQQKQMIGAKAVFDEMQQSTNSATTTPASSALITTTTTTVAAPAIWLNAQPAASTCSSISVAQEDTPIPLLFLRGGLGMMDNVLPANSTFLSTNISLSSMECLREFMLQLVLEASMVTSRSVEIQRFPLVVFLVFPICQVQVLWVHSITITNPLDTTYDIMFGWR
jgi:hypothetical protein